MTPPPGPGFEKRQQESKRGKRARAARQGKLESRLDPDGTLPPKELARRVREHYQEIGRRGGKARAARKTQTGPVGHELKRQATETARLPEPERHAPVTVAGGCRTGDKPSLEVPIDPEVWEQPDMRSALAARDVAGLYRLLTDTGLSQHQIARRTGQAQSEVSDILKGRRVCDVTVLERIADGLGITRERMGLSWHGPDGAGAYPGEVTVADPAEGDEMLRRQFERLLGLGAVAAFGGPVPGVGQPAELPAPSPPVEPPGRIGTLDIAMIRACREHLAALARTVGGQARASVQLADWADQWLAADASDAVRAELLGELAHLHTITAWCCHDSGAAARSHYHFARSVEFATGAGDAYQGAFALRHAGMMLIERQAPNDALKVLQLGELRLATAAPDDPRVPVLQAWCHVVSALALSRLDDSESVRAQAREQLAKARDGWDPPHTHAQACMDLDTGHTYLHLGQLDVAEAAIAVSARTFTQGTERREGVVADITLARLHVQTGEPRGLALAESAIHAVTQTRSGVARQIWLPPLAEALESRVGPDAQELARMARRVAAA